MASETQQAQGQEKQTRPQLIVSLVFIFGCLFFMVLLIAISSFITTGTALGGPLVLLGFPITIVGLNLLYLRRCWLRGSLILVSGIVILGYSLLGMLRGSLIGTFIAIPLIFLEVLLIGYFVLARYNVYFTITEEGQAKHVLRAGRFRKTIIQWKGYTLDEEWNVVPIGVPVKNGLEVEPETEGAKIYQQLSGFHRFLMGNLFGGFWFYGIWPLDAIHTYEFEWTGLSPAGEPVHHPKEKLDYIPLKEDVYFRSQPAIEDKNKVPLYIELALPIRVFNPVKAAFRIENWLEAVLNRIVAELREIIGELAYEDILAKRKKILGKLYKALSPILQDFRQKYGVFIREPRILKIDPPEEFRQATIRAYLAEREAERIDRVYAKIQEFEELGRLVRTLEALEKSPGQGAKWIIPLPGGVSDLLGRALGAQPLTQITAAELTAIRKLAEKALKEKEETEKEDH